ncbi:MAG: hypothetical protein HC909_02925 [Blastochloris sp.]|nr:hypothetical protein [Blastochloris sp.]
MPLFSQAADASSAADRRFASARLKANLGRAFGVQEAIVDRLLQTGKLTVFSTPEEASATLGRDVTGRAGGYLTDSTRAFIIANQVSPEQAYRLVLHEVGVHAGIEGLLGQQRWGELKGLIRGMAPEALLQGERFRSLVENLQGRQVRDPALTAQEAARLGAEHDVNPAVVRAWAEAEAFAAKGYEAEEALPISSRMRPTCPRSAACWRSCGNGCGARSGPSSGYNLQSTTCR